jgi:glutamate N-acetyltransferase/amino-acid N-acetyltransferase
LPAAEAALKEDEVVIEVQLGAGEKSWTAWTCDFSYDYVKINAEYHT